MKHFALAVCLGVSLSVTALATFARAVTSSDIAAETSRAVNDGSKRVANFWWLPPEYWIHAAKELDLSAEDQAKVEKFFRDYVIVAAIDADLTPKDKPMMAPIAELARRSHFSRGGEKLEVLREVNPEVSKLVPTLVYLLRTSLGPLGEGLRLLPLANLNTKGEPVLSATTPGELSMDFRFTDDGPVHEFRWHTPLTSVVGEKKCPKGGEPLEASFVYCPWHGVKIEGK